MKTLKIALDWTPNTNHTGIFVASQMGFYKELNLHLDIVSPATDDYSLTPAKKLEQNEVDLAVVPTESLFSLLLKEQKVDVKGIYAILQEDTSAIVTLKSNGISRPKDLDGKIYASFKARYEDKIVKQIIVNDGGKGELVIEYPDKLGIWETILAKKSDASWIFKAWEGIEAETQGVELNQFSLKDYGIPYGYSPLIIAKTDAILANEAHLKNFITATKKGYLFAQNNPEKAVEILSKYIPKRDLENIDILKSQNYLNPFYGNQDNIGTMKADVFQAFIEWLFEHDILEKKLIANDVFINLLNQTNP
ncbi:MAG: ABC transporter substrate-binding protein [Emticicia sp.]|nr:ABC transporter substrate-binding protein [Emticicia sp.]